MNARMSSARQTLALPNFTGFGACPLAIQEYHKARLTGMMPDVPRFGSATRSRMRRNPVSGRTVRIWGSFAVAKEGGVAGGVGEFWLASSASISSAIARARMRENSSTACRSCGVSRLGFREDWTLRGQEVESL